MSNRLVAKFKVNEWKRKLRDLQKIDLNRAKLKTSYLVNKRGGETEEVIDSEEEVESIQKNADSIKKVIKNLRRKK